MARTHAPAIASAEMRGVHCRRLNPVAHTMEAHMSELDERYERGQETRRMFGGGQITGGSSPGAWELAPDLERIIGEALFGTIWKRPLLMPVQREMVTLSCLIVLNREVQLRRHLSNALNVGLTSEQIVELIIHDTWYGGAPAGIQALTLCRKSSRSGE